MKWILGINKYDKNKSTKTTRIFFRTRRLNVDGVECGNTEKQQRQKYNTEDGHFTKHTEYEKKISAS